VTGVASLAVTAVAWFAVSETRPETPRTTTADAISQIPFVRQMLGLLAHRGFLLVGLISLMNAVLRTGGMFALIPLLATATLNLSVAEIGFAMMLSNVCGLVAAYPAGWVTDRLGRKAVIVPSTVLCGVSMAMFSYAPSYGWFIAASIVWSLAMSLSIAAPAAYAADSAPRGMTAAAMSTYRMTADAGYVIGPPGLGLLADLTSPEIAILAGSAILILLGVMFAIAPPDKHAHAGEPKA
jgi:MFS transporter, DHA1 family, multidrug resistance protein